MPKILMSASPNRISNLRSWNSYFPPHGGFAFTLIQSAGLEDTVSRASYTTGYTGNFHKWLTTYFQNRSSRLLLPSLVVTLHAQPSTMHSCSHRLWCSIVRSNLELLAMFVVVQVEIFFLQSSNPLFVVLLFPFHALPTHLLST